MRYRWLGALATLLIGCGASSGNGGDAAGVGASGDSAVNASMATGTQSASGNGLSGSVDGATTAAGGTNATGSASGGAAMATSNAGSSNGSIQTPGSAGAGTNTGAGGMGDPDLLNAGGQTTVANLGGAGGGLMNAGGQTAQSAGATGIGSGGAASGGAGNAGGGNAGAGNAGGAANTATSYPTPADTLGAMRLANQWFMSRHADPGALAPGNRTSNLWTRGVYYEGLMALYELDADASFKQYAIDWGEANNWSLRSGVNSTNADPHCAGQTYIDLYELDAEMDPERIADIQASIDLMVASSSSNAWTWIDAIQMSMPSFARLGALTGNTAYFNKMWDLYAHTRNTEGDGLFNEQLGLWWRDADFSPGGTYTRSPNDIDIYWSRGNGWVIAALARVLQKVPESDAHRAQYVADLQAMAAALIEVQREDGFWNTSLLDPTHCAGRSLPDEDGPETSGTALFVYGMGYGIRTGLLDEATYGPAVRQGWQALTGVALNDMGLLGFVQSTGAEPCDPDGQRGLGATVIPDFDDYGVGCFLLAGSEIAKLGGL